MFVVVQFDDIVPARAHLLSVLSPRWLNSAGDS